MSARKAAGADEMCLIESIMTDERRLCANA